MELLICQSNERRTYCWVHHSRTDPGIASKIEAKNHPQKHSLQAMVIEKTASGTRYAFDENKLHQSIRAAGFIPCNYERFSRSLKKSALKAKETT